MTTKQITDIILKMTNRKDYEDRLLIEVLIENEFLKYENILLNVASHIEPEIHDYTWANEALKEINKGLIILKPKETI